MTDYGRYKLSFDKAKNIVEDYDKMSDTDFNEKIRRWANFDISDQEPIYPIYEGIRNDIVTAFKQALDDAGGKITYILDLSVGIKLYELLNPNNGFDIITASDDDVWRYISLRVIPDLTFIRYPNRQQDIDILSEYIPGLAYARGTVKPEKDSIRIRKKRFYSHTRRIWIKTLWWYIHLGWQGSSEETFTVLRNNGTNIISHFIERPGRGYRESLFRNMLYAFSLLPEQKDSTFRAAAKLNLAKCVSVEPALTEEGERGYSVRLFEEVYQREPDDAKFEEDDSE